jgi:SAM-dependent methyltransferase
LRAGQTVSSEDLAELEARGLATSDRRLTRPGRNLAYHLAEYRRQAEGDFIEGPFLDLMALDQNASVLDIGAGAGQTLRLLGPFGPAERVGLDVDLNALAFGARLVELGDEPIRFVRASATALPFPEGRFSHVISRVALNLVHQARALREMARALKRGGILYCRAEGPGAALGRLASARDPYHFLKYLYPFAHGAVLGLSGRQLTPGTFLPSGVVFATARNITRILEGARCEIIRIEEKAGLLGFAWNHMILARKRCR